MIFLKKVIYRDGLFIPVWVGMSIVQEKVSRKPKDVETRKWLSFWETFETETDFTLMFHDKSYSILNNYVCSKNEKEFDFNLSHLVF